MGLGFLGDMLGLGQFFLECVDLLLKAGDLAGKGLLYELEGQYFFLFLCECGS